MITRIWHGWTTHQNAKAYEALLLAEIFPMIAARNVAGYRAISLLRKEHGDEVEFVTVMWFDSIASVKTFAGEGYEVAVVPPKARLLLAGFDERSTHYETVVAPPSVTDSSDVGPLGASQ